jgi:hypothetical protein
MKETYHRFRLRFIVYVLMDNHVHLVVQTPNANLSRAMQWLKVSYSMWFNSKYRRVGPLFQGRFKSVLVDPAEGWLIDLSLYVHLNPVRIKKLGLDKDGKRAEATGSGRPTTAQVSERIKLLREYRWSSFRFYAGHRPAIPDWLYTKELMSRLPEKQPFKQYRELAAQRISAHFDPEVLERLSSRLAAGGDTFIGKVRGLAGDGRRDVDCKKELRKNVSWERLIRVAEEIRGESWDAIRARRGDIGRAVVFRLARQYCGMTLREIGVQVDGLDYAAVSDLIRRYEKRGKQEPMEEAMVKILNLET